MREEAVVLCSWKRVRGTYKLWVQSRPRITGEGEDIWDAEDGLIDAIRSVAEIMTPALGSIRRCPRPRPRPNSQSRNYTLSGAVTASGRRSSGDRASIESQS